MKVYVVCRCDVEHDSPVTDSYYICDVDSVWYSRKEASDYCKQKNDNLYKKKVYPLRPYRVWTTKDVKGDPNGSIVGRD